MSAPRLLRRSDRQWPPGPNPRRRLLPAAGGPGGESEQSPPPPVYQKANDLGCLSASNPPASRSSYLKNTSTARRLYEEDDGSGTSDLFYLVVFTDFSTGASGAFSLTAR